MVSLTPIAPGHPRVRTGALVLSLAGLLGACASLPDDPAATRFAYAQGPAAARRVPTNQVAVAPVPPPVANNTSGGRYKVGAPYQAGGLWYVPAEQPNYDETGLASWYGDAFNGKPTANGEVFDMHAVSAAHATLPMPCLVEVTNLENGRTMTVRMNDRGPYHPGRIIDLSRAGAEQLGFALKGTAKVRVRYVGPAPLDGVGAPQTFAMAPRIQPFLATEQAPSPAPTYQVAPPSAAPSAPAAAAYAGGGYLVQAGAFSSRATAEQVASRLTTAGAASIRPVNHGGVTLYRVVVGPWTDRNAAADARGRVAALGFEEARLTAGS